MNKDWIQILSNIGVIAGLFFLGYQILQDRELMYAELLTTTFQDDQTRQFALLGENPAIAITKALNNECLSDVETTIVEIYYDSRMTALNRNDFLEQVGLFTGSWRDIRLTTPLWQNRYGLQAIKGNLENPNLSSDYRSMMRAAAAELEPVVADQPDCVSGDA